MKEEKVMNEQFAQVPLTDITPNPLNPRRRFDGPEFDELVASIRAKGVIQPILVRPFEGPTTYEIVAGERRYRASLQIATENGGPDAAVIPAMIRVLSDDDAFEIMTIENLQRKDLTELEEANSFKAYILRVGDGAVQILAERTGIDPRYIRRRVAILDLPKKALTAWEKGELKYGHLEELIRLGSTKEINEYVDKIIVFRGAWTVKQLKIDIDNYSPDLKDALFDKSGCSSCPRNSDIQKSLFSDEHGMKGTHCLDPRCFKKHQNNFIQANWKKRYKRYGANGFRFVDDVGWNDRHHMSKSSLTDECAVCDKLVSLLTLNGKVQTDIVCIGDAACHAKTLRISSSRHSPKERSGREGGNGTGEKPRVAWHGQHFREAFYKEQLPLRFRSIPPDEPRALHVTLFAMLEASRDHQLWFAKRHDLPSALSEDGEHGWYRGTPAELMAAIAGMDDANVLCDIRDLTLEIIMHCSGPAGHHIVAAHIGIELEKEWAITQEYLEKKTLAEMHQIGEVHGIFKDPKAQAFLFETLLKKRGNFKSCKKPELIRVFLESGVELTGKVPNEILAGTETEVFES